MPDLKAALNSPRTPLIVGLFAAVLIIATSHQAGGGTREITVTTLEQTCDDIASDDLSGVHCHFYVVSSTGDQFWTDAPLERDHTYRVSYRGSSQPWIDRATFIR